MSKLLKPKPAAIVVSSDKDEFYMKKLKNDSDDLYQKFFGIRSWIKYRNQLDVLSRLTYYSLTTLSGLQTLGEEYTNIVMVHGNQLKIPSLARRIFFVLMQSSGDYVIESIFINLQRILDTPNINLWPSKLNDPSFRSKAYDSLPHIKNFIKYLKRLNTAIFFLQPAFFNVSNRFFNIKFTALKKWNSDKTSIFIYKFVGWVSLIQLCLTIITQYYSSILCNLNKHNEKDFSSETLTFSKSVNEQQFDSSLTCSLCLCKRFQTTATICGHLFCWKCINEWVQIKTECPFCRQKIKHSRLVYLQNYE